MEKRYATSLGYFTDVHMKMQKIRVATGSIEGHLKELGIADERMEHIHNLAVDFEEVVEGYIAEDYKSHPVYPWTSRIWGCGLEAAPKVVGLIEGTTFTGALLADLQKLGVAKTKEELKESWVALQKAYPEQFQRRTSIYAFDTPSRLRRYVGIAPIEDKQTGKYRAERVSKGQKGLHYNPDLRMMSWRLLTRLMQQSRYYCSNCGVKVTKAEVICEVCKADISEKKRVVEGVWLREYRKNDKYYTERSERDGIKVIPTPPGRYCPLCLEIKDVRTTTKNCPDCGEKLMPKEEPPGCIFLGHLVAIAKRRTIRLWIDCLYFVWREALGLPVPEPYPIAKLGHTTKIDPWSMVDD